MEPRIGVYLDRAGGGHSIPAYRRADKEDRQNNWVVADNVEDASLKLGVSIHEVVQDEDVLDTWFSSSLLPLTICGWPDGDKFKASLKNNLFPLDILETGFDILTYWVSKMVMMSIALESKMPFNLVLLHGMICDSRGKKMSKSKGNVIDPLDIMDGATLEDLLNKSKDLYDKGILNEKEYSVATENQRKLFPTGLPTCGSDGLRAYLLSHDVQQEVIRVQVAQVQKIRRLSNKIWNVVRFSLNVIDTLNDLDKIPAVDDLNLERLDVCDLKFLHELAKCVVNSHECFQNNYKFQISLLELEKFWVTHLSSVYINEIRKAEKAGDLDDLTVKGAILFLSMETALKLFHPYMPHLTEFLYQKLQIAKTGVHNVDSTMTPIYMGPYPTKEHWAKFLQTDENTLNPDPSDLSGSL